MACHKTVYPIEKVRHSLLRLLLLKFLTWSRWQVLFLPLMLYVWLDVAETVRRIIHLVDRVWFAKVESDETSDEEGLQCVADS